MFSQTESPPYQFFSKLEDKHCPLKKTKLAAFCLEMSHTWTPRQKGGLKTRLTSSGQANNFEEDKKSLLLDFLSLRSKIKVR